MSEEKIAELECIMVKFIRLGWVSLVTVVCGAFAFGVWVSTLEARTSGIVENNTILSANQRELLNFKIETTANRFTVAEHNRFASSMAEMLAMYDKRVTRLEDSTTTIKDALSRIEMEVKKP